MTVKLVALWGTPADPEGFERDYAATHVPIVGSLPGLAKSTFSKAIDGPYFRMAELAFNDMESFGAALGSEQGQALAADGDRLGETYGAKLDVLIVEEEN